MNLRNKAILRKNVRNKIGQEEETSLKYAKSGIYDELSKKKRPEDPVKEYGKGFNEILVVASGSGKNANSFELLRNGFMPNMSKVY